ncbi:Xaa-Pro aminopeptidase [Endozoicomonas sp. SM1973]|uniref:Xaa-Pro aminopeptidase n=1 Tax=Spartinivicinus marinus TaxID=2994442 RepID=A0A853I639_9GAMM|nr:Xaa-Pro aminopeptidase [Spartinivicinus marinus]MCX4027150.1 Xaa-Pro aminopeptidase [Spartinivicinus marinus]NYZ66128.1 Xaa-Pro aminopeptidase [Spartinivicinus marinus]
MKQLPTSEYKQRRSNLMAEMDDNSIAIIPSAPIQIRNRDVDYPYRQDSDFYYLSGFPEPEAVLVLIPGRSHGEAILFCREKDPEKELWEGLRAGQEGACEKYGFDDAFPVSDIDEILPGLIEGKSRVYYEIGTNEIFDRRMMSWINSIKAKTKQGAVPPGEFVALDHILHEMRIFKSKAEIALMKKAAEISANAHLRAMKACQPGCYEYQLEAELLHEFVYNGCRAVAYNSIVGGGVNACILHYTENNDVLADGDLVLIDAGCELDHYASDITRTFPVNGKFSKEQRAIYELVLKAQLAAIEAVQPGNHFNQPNDVTVQVITEGLVELGLLSGDVEQLIKEEKYKPFYMHKAGHWLGMDVHDVGEYKIDGEWRKLEPGMVLTIEPGIYIAPDNEDVEKRWRGIGVRIEDDLVVTESSHIVLSADVPKEVAAIEALMAKSA